LYFCVSYIVFMLRSISVFIHLAVVTIFVTSCQFFNDQIEGEPIAVIGEEGLYKEDLKAPNFNGVLTPNDSLSFQKNQINDWALEKLLLHHAHENIPISKHQKFSDLAEKYEKELFIDAYKNLYVKQNLNTMITEEDLTSCFEKQKNFILKDPVIKMRYIKFPKDFRDYTATKRLLTRFKESDIEKLSEIKASFLEYDLNLEEQWLDLSTILEKLPILSVRKKKDLLFINERTIEMRDDQGLRVLIHFYKILKEGEPAPLNYIKDEIKQIILNKRKISLLKRLEKEIIQDAIQNKQLIIK